MYVLEIFKHSFKDFLFNLKFRIDTRQNVTPELITKILIIVMLFELL